MVAVSTIAMPKCGLYRTTRALPGDDKIPAGILVNFHNHSDEGPPVVHLPAFSSFNRWQWEKKAHPIRERVWLETLRPLLLEGYYILREDLEFDDATWPAQSLVQLGYDRAGTPIAFLAQRRFHLAENTLFFADHGIPLDERRLAILETLIVHDEPDPNAVGGEAPVAVT
jgi:hypothetical protein